ncbi:MULTISPECIES: precorrin-3B C(17)-methyltransferase [Cyanophyceae]|uniref:precorrin-3B C(17)-methyltransferase n=1 Tax=Cyanophyceae TaxID=3028117 RepID=UPI0016870FF7|nr:MULTISPECIES: precorrin-3B C(17)-methyltransferase [Cyanophyceae]MBD1918796.1 precorrin-3B C(17)-methyltransferase [Phormidium sp. FACHB-77]MBD2033361.1 precorrin-3B C(17)-methyltransferase [Phormidium sp. FACHB-322]MBD2053706.1 precorrin-3B C(17)-methyltransferase [Leptolyngbya sp. FACHB-60]
MLSFAAIAVTPAGLKSLLPLVTGLPAALWLPRSLAAEAESLAIQAQVYEGSLPETIAQLWSTQDGLIFALATGAVVRLIAPLLTDKTTDPAVVVVAETGNQVISLCGGHQGGADALTHRIALLLGAEPVITGSASTHGLPGVDVLGVPFAWSKGSGDWTGVSAALAHGKPIEVFQDCGTTLWQDHLPPTHPFVFEPVRTPNARLWISPIHRQFAPDSDFPKAQWHPRVLWVGIGCERDTPQAVIEAAIARVCRAGHFAEGAIAGIASLDLKADEVGLVALCAERQWPLRCFTAEELKAIPVPNPSTVVEQAVQTPSVAEAAAILAATGAAAGQLRVAKQVVRVEGQPGAVTVAIAQSEREYIPHAGHLALVGTGPGDLNQITPAAKGAIARANVVIGYGLYIDQIRPLYRPGQIVEPWPITQERQRADRAIDLARWGLSVAVVSSGDCGIYGMAGLVLEQLQVTGWDGETPSVEVFPGISALQSAAARVGAPLMHDFCAISLSDLLTPWQVIVKRLEAAAQADFVVALYNPKSKTRTEQIAAAHRIFMAFRSPDTPVAVVKSVYRPDEMIHRTTLANLLEAPIDMLTVVLIGNQSTQRHGPWLITPRGYNGNLE